MLIQALFHPPDDAMRKLLVESKVIAVVGASPNPDRASNMVARYLLEEGYDVIPVNPVENKILGLKSYPDLTAVGRPIDIVDVFRRSEFVPEVARQAVEIGARGLWLQLGVIHEEACNFAAKAGLVVVSDLCLKVEHHRLGL